MLKSALAVLSGLLNVALWIMGRVKEKEIRADGARQARQDSLEQDNANNRRAHEIDADARGTVIEQLDARDRMRQRD